MSSISNGGGQHTRNMILAISAVVGMLFGAIGFTYGLATRSVVQFVDIQRDVLQRVSVLETLVPEMSKSLQRIENAVIVHAAEGK